MPRVLSSAQLAEYLRSEGLNHVDARDWNEEWQDAWVAFCDLIAFASRAVHSREVVLNNIVRFARASTFAEEQHPKIRTYRFSDATYAVHEDPHFVLGFAVALQHACLAFNAETMGTREHALFHQTIIPRITIARGQVLTLPERVRNERRFAGVNTATLVVGDAVVRAYQLEKSSVGGLITLGIADAQLIPRPVIRGVVDASRSCLEQFWGALPGGGRDHPLYRGTVVDVPWLLLRPSQDEAGAWWAATRSDATQAMASFTRILQLGEREYFTRPGLTDLGAAKHIQAGIRHAATCYSAMNGEMICRPQLVQRLLADTDSD